MAADRPVRRKRKDEGGRMKAELKGNDEGGKKGVEVIHPSSFIPHPSDIVLPRASLAQ
jgi:hypothetical protein